MLHALNVGTMKWGISTAMILGMLMRVGGKALKTSTCIGTVGGVIMSGLNLVGHRRLEILND